MTTPTGNKMPDETHTPLPNWCIPDGAGNECIVCEGNDPKRPGVILFVVRAPWGVIRSSHPHEFLAEQTARAVRSVNAIPALVSALERIASLYGGGVSAARAAGIARAALAEYRGGTSQ